jgi:hypothetical protein
LTVDAQNIAQHNRVQLGRKVGDKVVIESGIDKAEHYIVGGFHFARPGAPVVPQMAGAAPAAGPGAGAGGPAGPGASAGGPAKQQ